MIGLQLNRAPKKPQLWNRYSYAVNNPLNFTDPRGEDVSIKITFRGDGWTDEDKDEIIKAVQEFYEGLDVGDVYVFDSAEFNETNIALFNAGVGSITVDSGESGSSHSDVVAAGEFLTFPGLTRGEKRQAIANAIAHETFVHQFEIGPHTSGDGYIYSKNRGGNVVPTIKERYGTITDSGAWRFPETRKAFVGGPLPVHADDRTQARQKLGRVTLTPPSQGPNRWWKFW